ncbi:response regulator transcription factor [Flavihumibacter petaseus]|uniref:Putative two-component response regulator n=1 Tax=Flavihumibacter petaseus NBRC 106054 TaxID=1220578 RepID=A0A0E9MVW7_9BACT|nr:response regulator transcription factor [Flavihumibacter petaseus]GAO41643.1 putative two-component response regulator [Flavihumibacter petaseus NBRC 106054]
MSVKGNILLAEDDSYLRELMQEALEEEGYQVTSCADGQQAIDSFDKNKYDIVLLDVMMPVKDGFMVARKIRQQTDVLPILFISTRNLEEDKIKGYNTGADDYITKPFSMKELLLKLEVFLRRTRKFSYESVVAFRIGKLNFSYTERKITGPEGTVDLKQKEADLLRFLCEHPNRILKREEVLLAVWGKDDFFLGRSMDVYMTKIRKILRADESLLIETIHGHGFRFTVPDE